MLVCIYVFITQLYIYIFNFSVKDEAGTYLLSSHRRRFTPASYWLTSPDRSPAVAIFVDVSYQSDLLGAISWIRCKTEVCLSPG